MASWFSWSDPYHRRPRREPSDVVVDTLMLEFTWQMKEAERLQRERDSEYRRLKTGVDYSWLASTRRNSYSVSTGERLGLEDLCCKVPPGDCGLVILKIREALGAHQPDAQEVLGLFRGVLLEELDRAREEEETRRLTRQWNNKRSMSMSLVNFRSRIKINPFGSTVGLTSGPADAEAGGDLKTVSEDVEKGSDTGDGRVQRGWSLPDY
ncbi:protein RD3 [Gadus chalcogrammus]|uniref:protein RD3 n=1 Tax=Gadus chalcogrammus TaxID=1042646 RepID=UPI0024C4E097|nr:protein RD3 [Gadus chalcogrammus]